ncbi:MAG: gamma-glutamylcyclotransferase [Myxococcales bacterium]|nr:gamma-glutamylcyclotransferase [Myxococcales bacterium]
MSAVSWVFGYGSLVWRPAFPFAERVGGAIEGFVRRFYQGSPDHRGVPAAPGRVVTLLEQPGARTWGMAYRLEAASAHEVLARLDVREVAGYERRELDVTLADGRTVSALCYIATPQNPSYLGPAPLAEMVAHVRRSRGPSGDNVEYVRRLADALRELGAQDEHVFELAAALDGA